MPNKAIRLSCRALAVCLPLFFLLVWTVPPPLCAASRNTSVTTQTKDHRHKFQSKKSRTQKSAAMQNADRKKERAGKGQNQNKRTRGVSHRPRLVREGRFSVATNPLYRGGVLTKAKGINQGPSGKESYYNFNMAHIVRDMRKYGFSRSDYWVRSDGCKMLGKYVMVAANYKVHPRGSLVATSRGPGIVCDTGAFARRNPYMLDIATNW